MQEHSRNRETIWTEKTIQSLLSLPKILSALELKSVWLYFKVII